MKKNHEKSISPIQVDPFVSRTWGTGSHLSLQAMLEISTSHLDVSWPSRDLTLSSPVGVTLKVDRPIQLRQVKKTDITRFCQVTHYRGYPCVTICFARCETTWVPPILVYYSIFNNKYRSFWFAALYWLDVLASLDRHFGMTYLVGILKFKLLRVQNGNLITQRFLISWFITLGFCSLTCRWKASVQMQYHHWWCAFAVPASTWTEIVYCWHRVPCNDATSPHMFLRQC